tara:strand:+ start:605 stop:1234 length:630 start_codon:yes stop_codon:yes gene_type:complete
MKTRQALIKDLKLDPENVRIHDERNIHAIKASLEKFGQQKPIVVDKDNMVIAGNGTLVAAKKLGWKKIAVVETELQGVDLVAYGIADNRTGELAVWDEAKLLEIMNMLQVDETIDEVVTGFSPVDLDQLGVAFDSTDIMEEWQGMPEFDQEDKTAYRSITVHFHNEEAIKDFEEKLELSLPKKAKYIWLPEIIIERFADKKYEDTKAKK